MCDPITAGIALGVSALTTITGSVMSANAQSRAAQAVANQNWQTEQAQYQGYYTRNTAAQEQTAAQEAVQQQALTDRTTAMSQMYQQEQQAIQQQQDVLSAENQQNAAIRANTDAQAQALLSQTSGQNLQDAQTTSQQQAQALLASTGAGTASTTPQGPSGTDPSGTDAATTAALARRTAEAASNIRSYGSKVAQVQSYAAPIQTINEAITANKTGIMPQQEAAQLLSSGSNVRLLPATVNFQNAQNIGSATDAAIQSREQQGLDLASLKYNDTSAAATLKQQDATTIAANEAAQAEANAKYDQSVGSLVSGIGNLGLYATGYFGGSSLSKALGFGSTPTAYTVTNHGA